MTPWLYLPSRQSQKRVGADSLRPVGPTLALEVEADVR